MTTNTSTNLPHSAFLPPFAPTIKPSAVAALKTDNIDDTDNLEEEDEVEDDEDDIDDGDDVEDEEECDENECTPVEEAPSTADFSPPPIESLREDCASSSSPPTIRTSTPVVPAVPESQDWSQLICRVEKKFTCLLCANSSPGTSLYHYNGRTEVVFHVVTRHLLRVS